MVHTDGGERVSGHLGRCGEVFQLGGLALGQLHDFGREARKLRHVDAE